MLFVFVGGVGGGTIICLEATALTPEEQRAPLDCSWLPDFGKIICAYSINDNPYVPIYSILFYYYCGYKHQFRLYIYIYNIYICIMWDINVGKPMS